MKTKAALDENMNVILCVGETSGERNMGIINFVLEE